MSLVPLLRRQLKSPLFALTVTLLVAAVVAVNATAFGAIHALRWKALPYTDGDRLVELQANLEKAGFTIGLAERFREQIAADRDHFQGAFGFPSAPSKPQADESGRAWRITRVTPDFAPVLGVTPELGRGFVAEDANGAAATALMLSDATWRNRFGADPDVVGRSLRISDHSYLVIGVMPRGFAFPDQRTDAWLPLVLSSGEREQNAQSSIGELDVVARLAPGTSVMQARDQLAALFAADQRMADVRKSAGIVPDVHRWRDRFAVSTWQALALLQLAALILLVAVVANLINLMLDRLLARTRELQIRRALGAGEGVIARSVVIDLALPLIAGLALGLAATPLGLHLLEVRNLLPNALPQGASFGVATLAAGFAIGALALVSTVAAAIASRPSLRISNRVGTVGLGRTRATMLIGQIMLTTALAGSVGLLLRSAVNLITSDRGFDETGVLMTSVDAVGASKDAAENTDEQRFATRVESLRADVASLPGVREVAIADTPPFAGTDRVTKIRVPGIADEQQARDRPVGVDYFAALGIGLVAGRTFEAADANDGDVAIVDERYVQRYLHGVDPLSAMVEMPDDEGKFHPARIVGVVRTVKNRNLDEVDDLPTIYSDYTQPTTPLWLITRAAIDADTLALDVRQLALEHFPDARIGINRPLGDLIAQTLAARRDLLEAFGGFALAALLLTAIGLASVLGFAIRHRTAELGMRMALGATPERVRALVLRQGGALIAIGIALGTSAGLLLARLLADRLFGITFIDPLTWCSAATLIMTLALFACWLPARRAAATDPIEALRHE